MSITAAPHAVGAPCAGFASLRTSLRGRAALMIGGSLLIVACAMIRLPLPITPVPITMQTFAVLLVAGALGLRLGLGAISLYLAYGMAGAPVFAGGIGPATLLGPTGGYLLGYLVTGAFVGLLADRGWLRRLGLRVGVLTHGTALLFILGVAWLALWTDSIETALVAGLWPFLPGAALKIALAATLLPAARRLTGETTP